ncbi:GDSL esterase/lipase 2-like [Ipomoea triloba]|uniref:GDSL esterase/lipase 2-like n=1 Tax=Ipomoea triloba TaxID=35885 RepID=UPI00125E4594|nr:GDSL esterase/lipase 2-like [Ipomoea triloba]
MTNFCVHVFGLALALLASFCNSVHSSALNEHHVALFVFGDSLFDAGNNNYINTTNDYRANFRPYGETSFPYPTGRFSDGFLIPDFIAKFAKLPLVPAYFRVKHGPFINGVNFASAGAGSLAETFSGMVIDLKTQLGYFKKVSGHLKQELGTERTKELLSNAVYMFNIGSNDYVSTLVSNSSLFSSHTKKEYVDMVIGNFTTVIEEIYKEGGRKFVFFSVGNIGCAPLARALNIQQTNSSGCLGSLQTLANMHNEALQNMITNLNKNLQGFKYSHFDFFAFATYVFNNPSKYGFKDTKTACCGSGPFRGFPSCGGKRQIKEYELCSNVEDYLFFDYAHASEKTYRLSATELWEGTTYVAPNNVKLLFQL